MFISCWNPSDILERHDLLFNKIGEFIVGFNFLSFDKEMDFEFVD